MWVRHFGWHTWGNWGISNRERKFTNSPFLVMCRFIFCAHSPPEKSHVGGALSIWIGTLGSGNNVFRYRPSARNESSCLSPFSFIRASSSRLYFFNTTPCRTVYPRSALLAEPLFWDTIRLRRSWVIELSHQHTTTRWTSKFTFSNDIIPQYETRMKLLLNFLFSIADIFVTNKSRTIKSMYG